MKPKFQTIAFLFITFLMMLSCKKESDETITQVLPAPVPTVVTFSGQMHINGIVPINTAREFVYDTTIPATVSVVYHDSSAIEFNINCLDYNNPYDQINPLYQYQHATVFWAKATSPYITTNYGDYEIYSLNKDTLNASLSFNYSMSHFENFYFTGTR